MTPRQLPPAQVTGHTVWLGGLSADDTRILVDGRAAPRPTLEPPFTSLPDFSLHVEKERTAMPGRLMRRVCTGTLVHNEQTVRRRVARPGRLTRRVCTGTPVKYQQTVRERVARPGRLTRRVCTGTLVHYEQTVRLSRSGNARRGPFGTGRTTSGSCTTSQTTRAQTTAAATAAATAGSTSEGWARGINSITVLYCF